MANGINLTPIQSQMRRELVVDPAEENLRRVQQRERSLINTLGINPNRTGGMLARSALGAIARTPEYARVGLGLQTPTEKGYEQIQALDPEMDEINRYEAISKIYRGVGLEGRAGLATDRASVLRRQKSADRMAKEQHIHSMQMDVLELQRKNRDTVSAIERRENQTQIDRLNAQISKVRGEAEIANLDADNVREDASLETRQGDIAADNTRADQDLEMRRGDITADNVREDKRLGMNQADITADNKRLDERLAFDKQVFESDELQQKFDNRMTTSNLALSTARLGELVRSNQATETQADEEFEFAMLRDQHGMAIDTGQYNIDQANYLLDAAARKADEQKEQASAEFMHLLALGQNSSLANRVLHLAGDAGIPLSETLNAIEVLEEEGSIAIKQQAKIEDFATGLMAVTGEDGKPLFTDEQKAINLATSYVLGNVEIITTEDGRTIVNNNPAAIANALAGGGEEAATAGSIAVPREVNQVLVNRESPGLWSKADLLTGFTNIAPDMIQRFSQSIGLPINVNEMRTEALAELRQAEAQMRTAFSANQERMTNLDAIMIEDLHQLNSRFLSSEDAWRGRALVVDRELEIMQSSVAQEASTAYSSNRADDLQKQLNAINSVRSLLDIPKYVSPVHWNEQMIDSMTAEQIQEVNLLRPDRVEAWGKANPQLQQRVVQKLVNGGYTPIYDR